VSSASRPSSGVVVNDGGTARRTLPGRPYCTPSGADSARGVVVAVTKPSPGVAFAPVLACDEPDSNVDH